MIVSDEQKQDTSNATTAHRSVLSTKMGGAVSHDIQRKSRPTESSNQHTSDFVTEGVSVAMHSGHVTQAQRKQVKVNSAVIGNHHATATLVQHDTNTQKIDNRSSPQTIAGQTSKISFYSSDKQKPQGKNSCKRTWNEVVSDDDDEFDKLCNMVDLSFDADVVSDQVTKVTTPDNSWSDSQNFHHTISTVAGSTSRQTWTCPMCNEQFEGRLVHAAGLLKIIMSNNWTLI